MTRSARRLGFGVLLGLAPLLAGCGARELGLPQVAAAVDSPDGGFRATIRNHSVLAAARQSLWIEQVGGGRIWLANLAEDWGWCDQVVWTPDGRRVAFVVEGTEVQLYAVPGGELLQRTELVPRAAEPAPLCASDLRLSDDGSVLTYRLCTPRGDSCAPSERVALAVPPGVS